VIKSSAKKVINLFLNKFSLEMRSTKEITNWLDEKEFHQLYDEAQIKTQMVKTDNEHRRQRHFTLLQFFQLMGKPSNAVAECGSWRGLSSYQMCHFIKENFGNDPSIEYHIFDTFEGLSELDQEDIPTVNYVTPGKKGVLNCPMDIVSGNLHEFPFITYHKGSIPDKFFEVENKTFSFVHIDVDLYKPIITSLEFFFPRLDDRGIIVIDDYGYLQFPGAYKAVEEFVAKENCPLLKLTTGQAVIFKK